MIELEIKYSQKRQVCDLFTSAVHFEVLLSLRVLLATIADTCTTQFPAKRYLPYLTNKLTSFTSFCPREAARGLSREYVLRIPSVS